MKSADAALSSSRKYVVCGGCGRSLARRDRIDRGWVVSPAGSPPPRRIVHVLSWDADWRVVEATAELPRHLERSPSAMDRLARGDTPTRRGDGPESPVRRKGFGPDTETLLVRCPWAACDTLNRLDVRRLDVADV